MEVARERAEKAVGTRDRVVGWLAANGDVEDPSGMASTLLARTVGYPGSSIAFAQLLSGMERSGLIARNVRGKRTYRIALTDAGRERAANGRSSSRRRGGRLRSPEVTTVPTQRGVARDRGAFDTGSVDYDELARRLLYQLARRLTGSNRPPVERDETGAEGSNPLQALEQRVTTLEIELARARTARVALEEENEVLRDQLARIRVNLEGGSSRAARKRMPTPGGQIDHHDIAVLQQMLVEREAGSHPQGQGPVGSD